jgi:hypothetical protein
MGVTVGSVPLFTAAVAFVSQMFTSSALVAREVGGGASDVGEARKGYRAEHRPPRNKGFDPDDPK